MRNNIKWPAPLSVIGKSCVDWWDGWLDFVIISTVWFFAQITVVLGPPATFGLYYVVHLMVREGQATGLKGMIRGARMYFGKALLWGLVNWVVAVLTYVNVRFYLQLDNLVGSVAMWVVILLALLYTVTQFYTVPFFMQMQEGYQKLFVVLRNGVLLALASPIFTFILVLFATLIGGLSAAILLPIFMGTPALIAVLGTRGMVDRLEKFKLLQKDPDPREVP